MGAGMGDTTERARERAETWLAAAWYDPAANALAHDVLSLVASLQAAEEQLAREIELRVEDDTTAVRRVSEERDALAVRLQAAEEALRKADEFLRLVSEWDMLSIPTHGQGGGGFEVADAAYWRAGIAKVRAALGSVVGERPNEEPRTG
jgi:hypothetical protein